MSQKRAKALRKVVFGKAAKGTKQYYQGCEPAETTFVGKGFYKNPQVILKGSRRAYQDLKIVCKGSAEGKEQALGLAGKKFRVGRAGSSVVISVDGEG